MPTSPVKPTSVAWPGHRPPPLLIWAVTLTGITANTLIAPVLPDILDDFSRPDSAAGLLVASASIPGVLAAPAIGLLADRVGRRRVLVPCLVLFGVMGVVGSLAPSYWTLVASRVVMGLGTAGLINLAVVLIGDHYDGAERIRQVGRNAAVLTAGLALMPMLSGALESLGGWRISLLPSSLALLTAMAARMSLDDVKPPGTAQTVRSQLGEAMTILRTPAIRATVLSGFLIFVMVFGLFLTTLPVHLEEQFSLSAAPRGLLLGIPSITSTLIALNLTTLRTAMGLRRLLVAAAGLFCVSLLVVGLAPTLIAVVLGLLLYGAGDGALVPSLQEVTVSSAPAEMRGVVLAVWVSAVRLGQAIGPLLFAAVFASIGTGATLAAGSLIAAAVLVIFARSGIAAPVDVVETPYAQD
ncbi:MAG: MFS transporter [Microthrixaceae bacterium]